MNSAQTKWLAGIAMALLAFILLVELRPSPKGPPAPTSAPIVAQLRPGTVTRVEFVRSNETFRAERSGGQWRLSAPLAYPANALALDMLVDVCARLRPQLVIPAAQVKNPAEFGLAPPQATVIFHQDGAKVELRIGARAPVSAQVYVQVAGNPAVAVADANLLELLPKTADDWRDRQLLSLAGLNFDRLRIRSGPRDLVMQRTPTNQLWRIALPPPVKRANTPRIEQLLHELQRWPVQRFISDDPKADLEALGLQTPETELAIGSGTNDLVVVQFGKSPTNQPGLVYARRLATTNVVLVAREWLDQLRAPYWDFCEHRLLDHSVMETVDRIEVRGAEPFTLLRQPGSRTNQVWLANDAVKSGTDPQLMLSFLNQLVVLEAAELAKEVVTDFAPYGLAPATRQISLFKSVTNTVNGPTNQLVAQLDFGGDRSDRLFARRHDENSVYVVPRGEVEQLAWSLFQIQDRSVWHFTTNQVSAVTMRFDGRSRRLVRTPEGLWTEGGEPAGDVRTVALEETLFRLGQLRAERWTARGTNQLAVYGVTDQNHYLSVELAGTTAKTNLIHFGNMPFRRNPYAAVMDPRTGQPMVFEFPRSLYMDYVVQYLIQSK